MVIDASFISLQLLLPVVRGWLEARADVIALIKPQFEAGKGQVGKGGVVRDPQIHRRVLLDVLSGAEAAGYGVRGLAPSPLKGPAGNIEFLVWLSAQRDSPAAALEELVAAAISQTIDDG